ncbi:MAG: NADH-ubiquinone oxidoreductase-F iron-sulfur binding region domain-containing protein, partial [Candidatus Aquilonibacter sp.]
AYLVPILERGAEWFAAAGTERSKGYKIVSISGHVQKPGNYEVPVGTTIRELIEIAGGLRPGRRFMAVQPGGGSSACIFEEHLDYPYDYESMAKAGSMMGSGAFTVFDDTTDFVKAAFNLIRFYTHESCGQCTPCREGGSWLERVLLRFVDGRGLRSDLEMIRRVGHAITGLNLCALGDSIEPFLLSVFNRFPDQFEARLLKETVQA